MSFFCHRRHPLQIAFAPVAAFDIPLTFARRARCRAALLWAGQPAPHKSSVRRRARARAARGEPKVSAAPNWDFSHRYYIGLFIALSLMLAGCGGEKKGAETAEPKITADSVSLPPASPQCASLTIQPVETEKPAFVRLTGRLVWNDDNTVRIFSPFAGIVRRIFVNLGEPVTNGTPLAEIQSADFGQAQADARKAASDYRRTERNLARVRDLFDHGAAPHKDVEGAEADFASAQAEKDRSASRLAIYGANIDSTNREFLLPSPLEGVLVEETSPRARKCGPTRCWPTCRSSPRRSSS